jgi:hypothetical protein
MIITVCLSAHRVDRSAVFFSLPCTYTFIYSAIVCEVEEEIIVKKRTLRINEKR